LEFAICQWLPDASAEVLQSLREQGVTALEPGGAFMCPEDPAQVAGAAERLRAAGIRVYSCHGPFGGSDDLSLADEEKRAGAVARHVTALAGARTLGAECMVVHPSGPVGEQEHQTRLDALYASLDELVREAEGAGVRLALENMLNGYLGDTGDGLRDIVDRFDSPWLGACFDTGHAHITRQGVMASFEAVRDRVITFHLQDNDGNSDRHLQPPYGTIDWDALCAELRAMDFAHPFAVEAPPWGGESWRALLREMAALFSVGILKVQVGDDLVRAVCDRCGHYRFGTAQEWFCACKE